MKMFLSGRGAAKWLSFGSADRKIPEPVKSCNPQGFMNLHLFPGGHVRTRGKEKVSAMGRQMGVYRGKITVMEGVRPISRAEGGRLVVRHPLTPSIMTMIWEASSLSYLGSYWVGCLHFARLTREVLIGRGISPFPTAQITFPSPCGLRMFRSLWRRSLNSSCPQRFPPKDTSSYGRPPV